jgi:hypothetical protein
MFADEVIAATHYVGSWALPGRRGTVAFAVFFKLRCAFAISCIAPGMSALSDVSHPISAASRMPVSASAPYRRNSASTGKIFFLNPH